MDVLMLGWEFPPHFAGGVGVVSEALARALVRGGARVTYLMPRQPLGPASAGIRLIGTAGSADGLTLGEIESRLQSYATHAATIRVPGEPPRRPDAAALYGPDLLEEVQSFAGGVLSLWKRHALRVDVIHAHDWTTFPAGLALRKESRRPLVVHVHITEFDKSGGAHADPLVYDIERRGMCEADRVVTVSRRIASVCIEKYGVPADHVRVVHNAVDRDDRTVELLGLPGPVVLFLGRVTLQKGPDYFLEAARRVRELEPDASFVMAGTGDMLPRMVERSAELGLAGRVLFSGFVDRDRAASLYARADVFVMPSVSEPFGIVALEAIDRGIPVIVSRQSGASEVLRHALKVDFWDVEQLAARIVATLRYRGLAGELRQNARREVAGFSWEAAAERVLEVYKEVSHA